VGQQSLAANLVQHLGRRDFSRVPLPAAMITIASFPFDSTSLLLINPLS